jgi:hypothetical protein
MTYDLYRKRFLWRFSFMRLRRLCLAIFAFLLFLSEPIFKRYMLVRTASGPAASDELIPNKQLYSTDTR